VPSLINKEKERLRSAVEQLETGNLIGFFAAIGRLRESLGPAPEPLIELHAFLDSLIATRVESTFNQLLAAAQRDALTGLGHRGAFNERFQLEVERAERYRRPFTLVLFDLDNFKLINDNFGHQVGDRVLVKFAEILRIALRQCDEPFRIGGDEFAALLPETSLSDSNVIGERIERLFHSAEALTGAGVSWGSAVWPADAVAGCDGTPGDTVLRLAAAADQRLYEMKASRGSNRRYV